MKTHTRSQILYNSSVNGSNNYYSEPGLWLRRPQEARGRTMGRQASQPRDDICERSRTVNGEAEEVCVLSFTSCLSDGGANGAASLLLREGQREKCKFLPIVPCNLRMFVK